MKVGANFTEDNCNFTVWAPNLNDLSTTLPDKKETLCMKKTPDGYWHLTIKGIKPNTKYFYCLNGETERPDPAAHFQPEGVFGPSAIIDHESFVWKDNDWHGIPLEELVMYELHVGAFTKEGTFAATGKRAAEIAETGINAVELMPVAQFSGAYNWGYDAVFPYAVQNTYGDPDELKRLVEEFHSKGIAVFLDVVYNHLGPEGNFLKDFGPYFLSDAKTPWGAAINFGGPQNLGVRNFFIENSVHWLQNYHLDGLRLDAVYAIIDKSPKHFLKELSETVESLSEKVGRRLLLIAENDHVNEKMLEDGKHGGYGLDATWHDNLHHSLHSLLTGENNWYYAPFGSTLNVAETLRTGFNECCTKPLRTQKTKYTFASKIPPAKLVVFSQNHDQIGNRPRGECLIKLAGLEAAKVASAIIIMSNYTPLLFLWAKNTEKTRPSSFSQTTPIKHLRKKSRSEEKKEAIKNGWKKTPVDSESPLTFLTSKIDWQKRRNKKGEKILSYYKKLISLKKNKEKCAIFVKLKVFYF